ncbi:fimbrial protein [Stenotrophomonas tumulicola]|uniref:Fimbrial protein n=1 Tax=Stenotrophomonas tumulicola TaxID=1685415 RepID=A0A7W3FL34_9GAMM|nr:fimbrial protein [Stenotrophomonas tumulicola]MBA8681557.1 fimbrial protein [Stenotrophomonas tumulicola]
MNTQLVLKKMCKSHCILVVFAAVLWMSAGGARAQVAFTPSNSTLALPARLHVGSTSVGDVLWTSAKVTSRKVDPSVGSKFLWVIGDPVLAPGFTDVYSTNLPGIGIRWRGRVFGNAFPAGVPFVRHNDVSPASNGIAATLPMQEMWFELVRVADAVTPGALTVSRRQRLAFNCGTDADCSWYTSVTGTTAITVGTCDMQASIPVNLGDHRAADLIASPSTPWVDFNIPLRNCPSTYIGLFYWITPTYGVGLGGGQPMLRTRPGGATGVVVDLWDNYHNRRAPLNAGQQLIGVAPGTPNVDLGFRARMYSSGATVTPGPVESSMDIRIDYR